MPSGGFARDGRSKLRKGAALIAFAVLLPASSAPAQDDIRGTDAQTTKAAVLKALPIGFSIEAAKSFMEAGGFRCERMHDQRYVDAATSDTLLGPADILWCAAPEGIDPFILKRWQVIFVDNRGRIGSVAVGTGLTGP